MSVNSTDSSHAALRTLIHEDHLCTVDALDLSAKVVRNMCFLRVKGESNFTPDVGGQYWFEYDAETEEQIFEIHLTFEINLTQQEYPDMLRLDFISDYESFSVTFALDNENGKISASKHKHSNDTAPELVWETFDEMTDTNVTVQSYASMFGENIADRLEYMVSATMN